MTRSLFALLMFVILLASCSRGATDSSGPAADEAAGAESREMDEFHLLMAEAFHPYKDSANLAPAKANAAALAKAASEWKAAGLPEGVDTKEMRELLNRLSTEAAAFEATVARGDDAATAAALTALHDLFHQIERGWHHRHGHEHGHDHH